MEEACYQRSIILTTPSSILYESCYDGIFLIYTNGSIINNDNIGNSIVCNGYYACYSAQLSTNLLDTLVTLYCNGYYYSILWWLL